MAAALGRTKLEEIKGAHGGFIPYQYAGRASAIAFKERLSPGGSTAAKMIHEAGFKDYRRTHGGLTPEEFGRKFLFPLKKKQQEAGFIDLDRMRQESERQAQLAIDYEAGTGPYEYAGRLRGYAPGKASKFLLDTLSFMGLSGKSGKSLSK